MALSGTITGSCNNSHYTFTCEWSATQNKSANTSTITANVYLNGNGYSTVSSYWCCTINGTQVTTNWNGTVSGKTKLGSRTWTVSHNSNGTCTTNISFSFSNRVTAGTYTTSSGSGSGGITLNTISNGGSTSGSTTSASTFTLNTSTATLGSTSVTLTISKGSGVSKHKVKIGWAGSWYLLTSEATTSYTFTPSIDYCKNIPNSQSGTATIKLESLNSSGSWVGETSKSMTFKVPSSAAPTVGISVTANNTSDGAYIAYKTTFSCSATNASAKYGATIKSYQWSGGYLNSTSSTATTGKLGAGNYTLTVKVTDSRGMTGTASKKVTLIGVSAPTLSGSIYRCDSSGDKVANGTYARASIKYNIDSSGSNAKKYAVYWKNKGATSWTTLTDWTTLSKYSASAFAIDLGSGWDITKSYEIKISVKDSYTTTSITQALSTQSALLNLEKDGVGIGKIRERGVLDVGGDMYGTGGLTLDGSFRVGIGSYVYGTGNDGSIITLGYVNPTNNGSEFGTSTLHTTIKSGDNPTWYTGTDAKSYSIWTDKDCSRSSSGNCQTWRFPNGMQVSIIQVYGTWNITTAWGNVYSSPFIAAQSFNIAFLQVPRVIINAHGAGTAIMVCQAGAPTTSATGSIYLWKPTQQTGVKNYIEYIAIGRWK